MAHYRAYLLDKSGEIAGLRRIECDTDAEARDRAEQLLAGQRGELWSGARKVARFDPAATASP